MDARRHMAKPKITLTESVVIYHAPQEGGWIAHGLSSDQVGIADSPVGALAQQLRLVDRLLEEAHEDPTLQYLREAPKQIQELAMRSKRLPRELYEIAHRRARGCWPEGWELHPAEETSFLAEPEMAV